MYYLLFYRMSKLTLDDRTNEMEDKIKMLSSSLVEKESEVKSRVENKINEWRVQYDAVEENLQAEILKLKGEVITG